MRVVRALAVADASAMPGLRRALSPESIDLVAVASTPVSVLAQLRRTSPDVVVVDLCLSRCDVFQLIAQLAQEHISVLALASGEQAASMAERALDAGASDVVERRSTAGSWHEESGSPHVLSLRVLAVAAAARPRPSRLSLRLGPAAGPQLAAAGSGPASVRTSPLPAAGQEHLRGSLRASPLSAAAQERAPGSPDSGASRRSPSPGQPERVLGSSLRASPLSAAESRGGVPDGPRSGKLPLTAAAQAERTRVEPTPQPESLRASPLSAAESRGGVPDGPRSGKTPLTAATQAERARVEPSPQSESLRASPLSAAGSRGRVPGELQSGKVPLTATTQAGRKSAPQPESLRASPLSAADSRERVPGESRSGKMPLTAATQHERTRVEPTPQPESLRASPLSAANSRGRVPGELHSGKVPLTAATQAERKSAPQPASPLSAADSRERVPVGPGAGTGPPSGQVTLHVSPLPAAARGGVPGVSQSGSAADSRERVPVGPGSLRASLSPAEEARASSSVPARALSGRAPRSSSVRPPLAAHVELVALGASTGGTLALAELLKAMPKNAPPMLVVQHMLPEFTNDFAERLNDLCEPEVRVAVDGEPLEQGGVLLAPGGRHLRVRRDAEQRLRVRVTDDLPVGKHRPSVDVLFQACAETSGNAAVGVLLTGMGDDGARGLLALHNVGARTLVQDQASSVCFGMPSAAIALGAAQQILPLREIAHTLRELVKTQTSIRA